MHNEFVLQEMLREVKEYIQQAEIRCVGDYRKINLLKQMFILTIFISTKLVSLPVWFS